MNFAWLCGHGPVASANPPGRFHGAGRAATAMSEEHQ